MKRRFVVSALIGILVLSCLPTALAQATGTVKGLCTDTDGKPIVGATVEWLNMENGRKYDLKTDGKGGYFSLGIAPGRYKVSLSKDGKELFHVNGVNVELDEVSQDFDLKKEMANAAQAQGMSAEQAKQQQEQREKTLKENETIKSLNDRLAAAKAAADAGDFDTAVKTITDATQVDPNRDLLWAKLGDYTFKAGDKQTDAAVKTKDYDDAVSDYEKAVDLKQKNMDADPKNKTPDATKVLAQYYNNLGKAQATAGKTADAIKSYTQAAQLDPTGAGMYYFNLGGTLTNANTKNDSEMRNAAIAAFDKAIAADPNRADAYYWKGTNLIGMATLQGDKMVAPPGTAEAFQKYLELAPTGPHAEEAKAMLEGLGTKIETTYGTKKKPSK